MTIKLIIFPYTCSFKIYSCTDLSCLGNAELLNECCYVCRFSDDSEMATGQTHEEKYDSFEVQLYHENNASEPTKQAFFFPTIKKYLLSKVSGKKVLDVGCGTGDWTKFAAECGAESVDGFDISEQMVELSKQATKSLSNVTVVFGDVASMPYGDNTFDIAFSFYITCVLQKEAFIKHFTELYRVLARGGKAVVLNFARSAFDVMFLTDSCNQVAIEKRVETALSTLPCYPSNQQINEILAEFHEIVISMFALDKTGRLYRVTDTNHLIDGQAVWMKTKIMVFRDYFYSADFINEQIKAAGLCVDYTEHYFTEEKRILYNCSNPKIKLEKAITADPPFLLYHLSKPVN